MYERQEGMILPKMASFMSFNCSLTRVIIRTKIVKECILTRSNYYMEKVDTIHLVQQAISKVLWKARNEGESAWMIVQSNSKELHISGQKVKRLNSHPWRNSQCDPSWDRVCQWLNEKRMREEERKERGKFMKDNSMEIFANLRLGRRRVGW